MSNGETTRRQFIGSLGAASTLALAGCTSLGGQSSGDDGEMEDGESMGNQTEMDDGESMDNQTETEGMGTDTPTN